MTSVHMFLNCEATLFSIRRTAITAVRSISILLSVLKVFVDVDQQQNYFKLAYNMFLFVVVLIQIMSTNDVAFTKLFFL